MTAINTTSEFFVIIATSHESGLVLENTFSEAAATLADKQGFVTSESQARVGTPYVDLSGFGRGGPTREDGRTASDVFSTPRPPDALENADGGFLHVPEGLEPMTAIPQRTTAPTPSIPADRLTSVLAAFNAVNLASAYIEKGNFPAARRKIVQALASINEVTSEVCATKREARNEGGAR